MPKTDRELMAEYAGTGSDRAFGELVARHSAGVHAACLRVLGEVHAAEDATQAVFLLLARKADRLRREEGLAGWLLLAARNVALAARREEQRRRAREMEVAEMIGKSAPDASWSEVSPHLDAALAALPAAQRAAVALRFIEGRSREESAREMGCSAASLSVTVSRALERLRRELSRRGVAVSAAVLGGMLTKSEIGRASCRERV
jgi:RNA polymerase sigma factor (sigma-70 family)